MPIVFELAPPITPPTMLFVYAINESVLPVPLFWLVELIVALPLDEVALELLPIPALTLGLTVKLLSIPVPPAKPKALP